MLPVIPTKRFGVNNEFLVKRHTRGGTKRILQAYARALQVEGVTSGLIEALDGDSLYWEALLQECLVEAPEHWWQDLTPTLTQNGQASHVVTFEYVTVEEFSALATEVQAWLATFRSPAAPGNVDRSQADPSRMVAPETLPPAFAGHAQ